MRKKSGMTLLEIMVVVGIIGLLSTAIVLRFSVSRRTTDLKAATMVIQQALTELREKVRNPQYSGNPVNATDLNGYGIYFVDSQTFFIYKDIKDPSAPANENHWVDPATTTLDDVVISRYSMSAVGVTSSSVKEINGSTTISGKDLFITYTEEVVGAKAYLNKVYTTGFDIDLGSKDGLQTMTIDYCGCGNTHVFTIE